MKSYHKPMGRGVQTTDRFKSIFGTKRGLVGQQAAQVEAIERETKQVFIWEQELTDKDYLDLATHIQERKLPQSGKLVQRLNFVLTSRELWCPESARQKRYYGHIALQQEEDGTFSFVGVATYGGSSAPHSGSTIYATSWNLRICLKVVNQKLTEKQTQRRDRYVPKNGGGLVILSRQDFDEAFRAAAKP